LRERLGIDDIILVLGKTGCDGMGMCGKMKTDWVKKCLEYREKGSRRIIIPKRTWKEVVQKDCQSRKLNRDDTMERCRWKKLMKDD